MADEVQETPDNEEIETLVDQTYETDSSAEADDAPAVEPTTDDAPVEDSWLTDDVATLAESYGIPREDAEAFGEDGLRRAMGLIDRRAASHGQAAMQPPQSQYQPQAQPGQPQPPAGFQFDWGEDGKEAFDPQIVANLEKLQAHYDERYSAIAHWANGEIQRQQEEQNQRMVNDFHSALDGLPNEVLGNGDPGKLSQQQQQNRSQLFDQTMALMYGRQQMGMPAQLDKSTVHAAFGLLFPNHVKAQAKREFQEQIEKRGKSRLGTGQRTPRTDTVSTPAEDMTTDPQLLALYEEMTGNNE